MFYDFPCRGSAKKTKRRRFFNEKLNAAENKVTMHFVFQCLDNRDFIDIMGEIFKEVSLICPVLNLSG